MNIRTIICEAINEQLLNNYSTNLARIAEEFRTLKVTGAAYNFVNNFYDYCLTVCDSIDNNRIESATADGKTDKYSGSFNSRFYRNRYDPGFGIHNTMKGAGLGIDALNGVWDAFKDGYHGTRRFFGFEGDDEYGYSRSRGGTYDSSKGNIDKQACLRPLIEDLDSVKQEYNKVNQASGGQLEKVGRRVFRNAFNTLDEIRNVLIYNQNQTANQTPTQATAQVPKAQMPQATTQPKQTPQTTRQPRQTTRQPGQTTRQPRQTTQKPPVNQVNEYKNQVYTYFKKVDNNADMVLNSIRANDMKSAKEYITKSLRSINTAKRAINTNKYTGRDVAQKKRALNTYADRIKDFMNSASHSFKNNDYRAVRKLVNQVKTMIKPGYYKKL